MQLRDLLSADSTFVQETVLDSKKRVLQTLSQLLAKQANPLEESELFEHLLTRERLGSTGIGYGIAIPHARIAGISKPVGALLQLKHAVDFDSPDKQGVDILFGLLVPEDATDEHLKILAHLAKLFKEESVQNSLRQCQDARSLFQQALKCEKDYG
jgi:nitrogen PTS system EIIA component